jgi:hypothetical protein
MAEEQKARVRASSIVMRAIDARTFSELQAFTKDLEGRPTERLLREIADLVKPSESKAEIVSYVIATKYRHAGEVERRNILARLDTTLRMLQPGAQHDRVHAVVERLRTQES